MSATWAEVSASVAVTFTTLSTVAETATTFET